MTPECYLKYKGISDDDKDIINAKILEKLIEIDKVSKLEEIILSNLPDKIEMIEPSRTIYTYGFNFKNQSNNSVKKIGTSSKIKAEVYAELSKYFMCEYDEAGSIGKRYRRYDEIGVPFCITIDFDTLEDNTVTIRDRDTMEQIRLPIADVEKYIEEKVQF